jgi:hypothetical protein
MLKIDNGLKIHHDNYALRNTVPLFYLDDKKCFLYNIRLYYKFHLERKQNYPAWFVYLMWIYLLYILMVLISELTNHIYGGPNIVFFTPQL